MNWSLRVPDPASIPGTEYPVFLVLLRPKEGWQRVHPPIRLAREWAVISPIYLPV